MTKPKYMPWLTPCITVTNVENSMKFYQKAFGFQQVDELSRDDDGNVIFAQLKFQDKDAVVMVAVEGAYGGTSKAPTTAGTESSVAMYIYCDNVDQLFEQAQGAGATVTMPPEDMFWGDRMCGFTDPDGHRWSFATHVGEA